MISENISKLIPLQLQCEHKNVMFNFIKSQKEETKIN